MLLHVYRSVHTLFAVDFRAATAPMMNFNKSNKAIYSCNFVLWFALTLFRHSSSILDRIDSVGIFLCTSSISQSKTLPLKLSRLLFFVSVSILGGSHIPQRWSASYSKNLLNFNTTSFPFRRLETVDSFSQNRTVC